MPSLRRLRRRAETLTLIAVLALSFATFAPPATGQLVAPQDAPTQAESSGGFATPVQAFEAFARIDEYLRTGDDGALDIAASALQIEGAWLSHKSKARTLAQRLGRIFDHVAVLDPERFAREVEQVGDQRALWTVASEVDPAFVIELGFVEVDNGGWLIDAATVARIDGWYGQAEGLALIAEAGDKPRSLTEAVRSFVPRRLRGGGFLIEPWQWIGLLLLFLLAFLSEVLIRLTLRPLIRRASRFEGVSVEPQLLQRFERPFGWLVIGLLFAFGIQILDLPTDIYTMLKIGVGLFTTFVVVWACYRLVDIVCWPLQVKAGRTDNKFDDMLVPLLRRTLKVVVAIVGLVFVVSRITGDVWHVLAGLSIGSLAIGFAAKDSIENLFGTFTVLLDSPFKIGDLVRFDEIEGTVEEVGFRSTRIRTAEDSLVTVPNSKFIGNPIDNLGSRRQRRVLTSLSLAYDTPPEKIEAFCEGARELVRAHPWTRKDTFHAWLSRWSASSLDVEFFCFIETREHPTFLRERHRMYLDLLRLASELKVEFAFPTQTVWQVDTSPEKHAEAPRTSEEAIRRGRDLAHGVAALSLAPFKGVQPPPVRFDPKDPDAIWR